ncbi:hypothetical protein [Halalkalicoccus salilacus]|uniref:hypothetical protein n=1 Tax=Halalkalicoccus salilacus TaxID=3117459 RepID=UPI00300EAC1C
MVAQLEDRDELLLIYDVGDDPITEQHTPEGVRLVAAGEPEHCSGTANAIAVGMVAGDSKIKYATEDE